MVVVTISKTMFKEKTFKYDNITVQTDEKLEHLRNFGLFRAWDTKLNSLVMYFERKKYKRGNILYKEGEQPNGFFLILGGEIEISLQKEREVVRSEDNEESEESKRNTVDVIKVEV